MVISTFCHARKWRRAWPASTAPVFVATAASACADAFTGLIQIAAMEHLRSLHSNPMSIKFVFFT